MGGWRDVMEETRALAVTLDAIPDTCPCQDAAGAVCACCQEDQDHPACDRCRALLDDVSRRVYALMDAAIRFMPVTALVVTGAVGEAAREPLAGVDAAVAAVDRILLRLRTHDEEYLEHCRAARLHHLKHNVAELQASIDALGLLL